MNWFTERRQEFIEATLRQFGQINRTDVAREFDVSIVQASKDISYFLARTDRPVRYDVSSRCYVTNQET